MVATLEARSLRTEARPDVRAPVSDDELIARIKTSRSDDEPSADRRQRAQDLVALTGCSREPLERLRDQYLRRLHRASDDFDATDGLRVVAAALTLVPRPDGPWSAQY